jgi:S1-C subfamily serine protease
MRLAEFSNALADLTERAARHTVAVHTEKRGSSSGVIWRPGVVVTAEHPLQRDEEIQVTLANGSVASASLAGRDPSTDIAVLKCAEAMEAPATFGDAAALKVGHLVLVVGRTRASGPVAAVGAVSLAVPERKQWGGATLAPYVRVDVGLQPTIVGGAAVTAEGTVAGIATPRFARFGAIILSSAMVSRVADVLLARGRVPKAYLGVGLQPVRLPEDLRRVQNLAGRTAPMVLEVEPGGPAHKAGFVIGDIVLRINEQNIAHLGDVQAQLTAEAIGKAARVTILRGGETRELSVIIGERNGREE